MKKIFGKDLRAMRMLAGKTTVAMAKAAGVKTRKTYENWEKNQGTPNVNQFFDMAKFCGLDGDKLTTFFEFKEQISTDL